MYSGDLLIGEGRLYNVTLRPGHNKVPIRATLDVPTVLSNLPEVLQSQAQALSSGNLRIGASGNSTICYGKHIPYYEKVLNGLHLSTDVPIVQILKGFLKGSFSCGGKSGCSNLANSLRGILNALNNTSIGNILEDETVDGKAHFDWSEAKETLASALETIESKQIN
jgi:hypothetical protein